MISIFDFQDYREFISAWIDHHQLRGLKKRLADAMGVSSTMISLILKGDKHLSQEQAHEACEYFRFNDKESEFFFLLADYGRAGTQNLKQRLLKRIKEQQEQAKKISRRVKKDTELTDQQKAIYYSSWIYTGIRNLSALDRFHEATTIAERLNITPAVAAKVIDFLLEHNLCRKEGGKLSYGHQYIHLDSDSPFVGKHHQNWRLKGFQSMDQYNENNLYYTCPMSLSREAAEEIRKLLPKVIEEVLKIMKPSTSEETYCFNMDWFKF